MCVYSMISGHYMEKWPLPSFPHTWPSPYEWADYEELVRKAREYDRITNQPDCPDPAKEEWEAKMRKLIREEIAKSI